MAATGTGHLMAAPERTTLEMEAAKVQEAPPGPTHLGTPSRLLNCVAAISRAEPVMKPSMTGADTRRARKPAREKCSASWMRPVMMASSAATRTYVSLPSTTGAPAHTAGTLLRVRMLMMAVGPVSSCRLEPTME